MEDAQFVYFCLNANGRAAEKSPQMSRNDKWARSWLEAAIQRLIYLSHSALSRPSGSGHRIQTFVAYCEWNHKALAFFSFFFSCISFFSSSSPPPGDGKSGMFIHEMPPEYLL